jgi:hypothetical protein
MSSGPPGGAATRGGDTPAHGVFAYDRLGVLVALVLFGAAFSLSVPAPAQYVVLALLLVVFLIGQELLLRAHPRYRFSPALLALPATHLYGVVLLVPLASAGSLPGVVQVSALSLLGALLAADVLAERLVLEPAAPGKLAGAAIQLLGYVGLFLVLTAVFQTKARMLTLAPITMLTVLLVAHRLLRIELPDARPAAGHAFVVALCVTEVMWPLTYWPIGGLPGGAALLLLCYILIGVLGRAEAGTLARPIVLRYAALGAVSLALIFGRVMLVG